MFSWISAFFHQPRALDGPIEATPEIWFFMSLGPERSYALTKVYQYKTEFGEFFFDAYFCNEERIDGELVYDVAVSLIGKRNPGSKELGHIRYMKRVKAHISAYFKEHPLQLADHPPRNVYFR